MGLLAGLTPAHVRLLCDNPMEGGFGYRPHEVGDMTLDQIFMLTTDRKVLRRRLDGTRTMQVKGVAPANDDGTIRGRAADGTPIRGVLRRGGKSKAAMLAEQQSKPKKRRRKNRGN